MKVLLQRIKEEFNLVTKPENPITIWDISILGVIFLLSFLFFQESSVLMTAGVSFGYLNRHFLDFYEYVTISCGITDVHCLPATYLTYAIWNVPLKLFRIVKQPMLSVPTWVIFWYKFLPTLTFLGSGYMVFLIARQLGMGRVKSKLVMYAWLTFPMAFLLEVMGGREEIFPIFFMLLGFYGYLKEDIKQFVTCFAVAGAYHPFVILIFIPLLLLKEKRFLILFFHIVFAVLPFALEMFLYGKVFLFHNKEAYLLFQNQLSSAGMNNGGYIIQYVILAYLVFCGWVYLQHMDSKKALEQMALYLTSITGMIILGLIQWKPETLIFALPFLTISAFSVEKTKLFHLLDIIWMFLFTIFVVSYYDAYNESLLISRLSGILGEITPMRSLIGLSDLETIQALFLLILIVSAVFKHPKYALKKIEDLSEISIGWMRARFLIGMAAFLVPFLLCVIN